MGQCKMCGQKGFFLIVDANGLCTSCGPIFILDIKNRSRIITDCLKLVNESKSMKTRLSRLEILIQHAQFLLEYENKNIPTIEPPPSQILTEYRDMGDEIILESVTQDVEKALAKAKIASTSRASINQVNKVLITIQEAKRDLRDKAKLDAIENQLQQFIYETQLNTYLEAARKAEFKGQKKKALDQYQEALYFLRNDKIDDSLQSQKISEIESKIAELSN